MTSVYSINDINSDFDITTCNNYGSRTNDPIFYILIIRPVSKTYGFTFYIKPETKEGIVSTLTLLGFKELAMWTNDSGQSQFINSQYNYQIMLFNGYHSGLDRPANVEASDEDIDFINILFAFRDE